MKNNNNQDNYESQTCNGLWPFSVRDYRVVDLSVSGLWGVPGVNGTQKSQKSQK